MTIYTDIQENVRAQSEAAWRERRWSPAFLRLGNAERRVMLATVDLVMLQSALVISVVVRTDLLPDVAAALAAVKWFVTLTLLWLMVAAVFDGYNLARAASTTYGLFAAAGAASVTSLIYLAIPWLTPPIENRMQAFLFVFLSFLGVSAWRLVYARLFSHPAFQRRALIVGAGGRGQVLAEVLQTEWASRDVNPFRGTGYVVLGFVDDVPDDRQTVVGLPVLGDGYNLIRMARTLEADEVVVAVADVDEMTPELFEAILDCRELGIPVTNMVTLYERLTGRVAVEYASHDVEIASGRNDEAFLRFYSFGKRLVDILLAAGAIISMLPIMAGVAVANALTSPGPLFFRQQRVGWGGRPFKILKFRTMVPNAEGECGAVWARTDDDRVTPIGRWLRKTHLDELPQALNVLKGEMSMVGPRPERPEFVGELTRRISFYRARHAVRPGITGWAQINQWYGDSVAAAQEKLEYDLFYVKHASFFLDMLILLRTVAIVLGLRGR